MKHLLLFLLLVSASFAASPLEGPARVIFYSEPGFKGEWIVAEYGENVRNLADVRNRNGQSWDNRIASFRCYGGAVVTLYADPRFKGQAITLGGEVPFIGRIPGAPRKVSSICVDADSSDPAFLLPSIANYEATIRQCFLFALDRNPDSGELAFYVKAMREKGWTVQDALGRLRASSEARVKNNN